jgi:hypothetical protein
MKIENRSAIKKQVFYTHRGQLFYFMPHKNGDTSYKKNKIRHLIMKQYSYNQWVGRRRTNLLIKMEIGCPI